jgi:hypothetical protein
MKLNFHRIDSQRYGGVKTLHIDRSISSSAIVDFCEFPTSRKPLEWTWY